MASNDSVIITSLLSIKAATFTIADYIVFAVFLCISGAVGIFYSIRGQRDTAEYFFGGKKIGAIPVGISTGVSFMSASSLVGIPAEIFINGYSYVFGMFCGVIGYFLGCVMVTSVLQPLKVTSLGEYLDKRFGSKLLTYSSNAMVLICILQYMGVCMLGSVIAFQSATGGQITVIFGLIIGGAVGVFYTSVGGLKAVIWTDVLQSIIMLLGITVVVAKSIIDTPGGLDRILRLNFEYNRIHKPDWRFNPTIRHTFWGLAFGYLLAWCSWCVQPACIQRLCSAQSKKDSIIIAGVASCLWFVFSVVPAWAGMNMFGYYTNQGCDPFAAGWVKRNEIVLYFIRDRLAIIGFQGLFIATLFAGSLSSLSSGLNSASAILWLDVIKPIFNLHVSEVRAIIISKCIVVIFGVASMLWCYALYRIGGLITQLATTISSSIYGAYFSLFLVSIFFRCVNSRGAFAGMLVSFSLMMCLGLSKAIYGTGASMNLPTVVSGCSPSNFSEYSNFQVASNTTVASPPTFMEVFTSISYEWLTAICIILSLLVSLSVSACFGGCKMQKVDEALLLVTRKANKTRQEDLVNNRDEYKALAIENPEETQCA